MAYFSFYMKGTFFYMLHNLKKMVTSRKHNHAEAQFIKETKIPTNGRINHVNIPVIFFKLKNNIMW